MQNAASLFATNRTRVKRMESADLPAMLRIYSDRDAMKWVGDGEPITSEECDQWLVVTHRNYATRGYGMCVVESSETGAIIGFCGLVHPGGQTTPEIKYALVRDHWGQGLATEIVSGMLDYGREQFAMTEIIATVHEDNGASLRVLEKCGMRRAELRGTTVVMSS